MTSRTADPIPITLPAADWKLLRRYATGRGSNVLDAFVRHVGKHLCDQPHITIRGQLANFEAAERSLQALSDVPEHVIAPLTTRLEQVRNGVLPEDMENARLAMQRMDADPDWPGFEREHLRQPEPVKERTLF